MTRQRVETWNAFAKRLGDRDAKVRAQHDAAMDAQLDQVFACCFNAGIPERMSFWTRFGGDGAAFITNPERLEASIAGDDSHALLYVNYVDFYTDAMINSVYVRASTKDSAYEDEHEARLIVIDKNKPAAVKLRVDLATLIIGVVIHPKVPTDDLDDLKRSAANAGIDPGLVRRSRLADPPINYD